MSDPIRVPPGVESLVRSLVGGTGDEADQRTSTFARGVALGALVGAAIAGSTIWQRRQARSAPAPAEPVAPTSHGREAVPGEGETSPVSSTR